MVSELQYPNLNESSSFSNCTCDKEAGGWWPWPFMPVPFALALPLPFFIWYFMIKPVLGLRKIANFRDRYVFITGCDSGFGRLLFETLAQTGCRVIAGCYLSQTVSEYKEKYNEKCFAVQVDISKKESVLAAFEEVQAFLPEGEGLWALVNNAGIATKLGPSEWFLLKDYHQVLGVNFLGTVAVTTTFLPLLKRTKGRIVSVTSCVSRTGMILSNANYVASKSALTGFFDSLRREIGKFHGISVHLIEPGFHNTPMNEPDHHSKDFDRTFNEAPLQVQQQYQHIKDELWKVVSFYRKALVKEPKGAVNAMQHAIYSQHPYYSYQVGIDAYGALTMEWVPDWASDFTIEIGLPKIKW